MNPAMFFIGTIIFGAYLYFLIWNIFYNAKKNKEENYPGDYYNRHKQPHSDSMDMDGMGNFSRFPVNKELEDLRTKKVKKTRKSKNIKEKVK